MLTLDAHPGTLLNWMPSPDATRKFLCEYNPLEGRIRLLSLKGEPERDLEVKGWAGFNSVDWAADGKSLFVSSQSPISSTLLHVDLNGHGLLSGTSAGRGARGPLVRQTAANSQSRV